MILTQKRNQALHVYTYIGSGEPGNEPLHMVRWYISLVMTTFRAIVELQAFPKIVFENGRTISSKETYCEKVAQLFFCTPLLYVSLVGFVVSNIFIANVMIFIGKIFMASLMIFVVLMLAVHA